MSWSVEDIGLGVQDSCSNTYSEAVDFIFHFVELALEVIATAVDGRDADGGAVPHGRFVEFGYGDVEAVTEFVFERTHDLAAILEGLRVFDGEVDGERGDGHVLRFLEDFRLRLRETHPGVHGAFMAMG